MKIDTLPGEMYSVPEKDGKIPTKVIKKSFNLRESLTLKIILFITVWSLIQIYITFSGTYMEQSEWARVFVLDSQNPTYYWTYITSIFSHGSLLHLFVNMIVFVSFGRFIELEMSKREYIGFLLFTGLIAGISQVVIAMFFVSEGMQLVGFSGALSGVLGYVAVRANIPVLLFFIIQVQIRTAVFLFIGITLFIVGMYGPGAFRIAHTAHLGGLFAGLGYGLYKDKVFSDALQSRLLS